MQGPRIIETQRDFIAVEKSAGLIVHPGPHPTGSPTLVDWVLRHFPEVASVGDAPDVRPGIVHRLDRATSGVMLIARTQHGFDELKKLFQNREIKKEYRAIVHGTVHPASGVIDRAIGIKPRTTKRSVFSTQMQKDAVTRYEVVEQLGKVAHVAAFPETGRTHQIRVHFASLGHPVLGDAIYAPKRKDPAASRLMLHAHKITFTFDGVEREYGAPIPEAFEDCLAAQRS
jgi:23S rRNA pseudouridine1911/1915/1917 synthase